MDINEFKKECLKKEIESKKEEEIFSEKYNRIKEEQVKYGIAYAPKYKYSFLAGNEIRCPCCNSYVTRIHGSINYSIEYIFSCDCGWEYAV